jgi:hypothetical protein
MPVERVVVAVLLVSVLIGLGFLRGMKTTDNSRACILTSQNDVAWCRLLLRNRIWTATGRQRKSAADAFRLAPAAHSRDLVDLESKPIEKSLVTCRPCSTAQRIRRLPL